MPQLEDLLQQCTLKITIPGQTGWGTGFFVAPRRILTCAHVVKKAERQIIQVQWQNRELEAIVERVLLDPYDLALLQVALPNDYNPPCVYLDEEVRSRDPLYLFGYPDEGDRQGEPRTFNCDGITGSEIASILFNLGQVRPGMSGSPLLNQRTGKVCGIVKFTRDRSIDLGGGAIPTRVILEQFPELRSLQQAFHEDDRRWSVLTSTGPAEFNFRPYLEAVINHYSQQRHLYTPTDALLPLEARSVERPVQNGKQEQQSEKKVEQFPVLEGLRKYALGKLREHVLLAGRPGSGKSTTLRQLVVNLAEERQVPVLIRLKGDRPVPDLIQAEFRRMKQRVTPEEIDEWLLAERLVLLLDGVNEIPNDDLRRKLAQFREDNPKVPMIFTTRDLAMGGDLGIGKRLEMKPLSERQMREFVGKYLPEHGERLLGQLRDRLREVAETPLLLKMLCDVFDPKTGQIPQNKGELFRQFDRDYDRIKKDREYVPVAENFWEFKSEVLQHLAFSMIKADPQKPTEPWLTISRRQAEATLESWLNKRGVLDAPTKAKIWLRDLVRYHLLQDAAKPGEIEFHHQLFQEYYAAEALLQRLPNLSDEQLKRDYLNYLKWTEPLALMLALVEEEDQALRVVKLAMNDVDLMLGAKLAGEVQPGFQATTVTWINDLEIPLLLKCQCWVTTHSTKAIPALLRALKHQNFHVRYSAVKALGEIGSVEAIPGLFKATEDQEDAYVRRSATDALGKLGSVEAIPGLLKALEHQDWDVRYSAAEALGEIGSVEAIPGLLKALEHPDRDVRWNTARTLGKLGSVEAIPGLLKALEHQDWDVRYSAAEALGEIGSVEAIPGLLKALEDQDSNVRSKAAFALGQIGDVEAIPGLLKALEDQDSDVRYSAARTLGNLGSVEAIPGLLKALEHQDWDVRRNAAYALGKIGSDEAIPGLLKALNDQDFFVYRTAAEALGKHGSEQVIAGLLQALEHQNFHVRYSAAEALGEIGSVEAIPGLLKALEDQKGYVRYSAAEALGEIGSVEAIPGLLKALKDQELEVRRSVVDALGQIGSVEAIPELLKATEDQDSDVRWRAADALGKIGSVEAIPGLLKAIEHQDSGVRRSAVDALGQIGSVEAIPGLLKASEDQDAYVRRSAVDALGQIGSVEAIPGLLKATEDQDAYVRRSAVDALGQIGSVEAIPGLLKASEDQDAYVRRRTAEALGQLGNSKVLAELWQQQLTSLITDIYSAISAIQNRCKYYNYEIWQAAIQHQGQTLLAEKSTPLPTDLLAKIDQTTQQIDRRTQHMANEPKNNFSGANFNAPVNFGDHPTGDFIGTQNNYASNAEVQGAIADLQTLLTQLQSQNPHVTTETEALTILDAEFTEIKQSRTHRLATLRKQLLNPERHLQATKAALGEVAKHYLEESVWAKTLLTYADKLSEEPNHGA